MSIDEKIDSVPNSEEKKPDYGIGKKIFYGISIFSLLALTSCATNDGYDRAAMVGALIGGGAGFAVGGPVGAGIGAAAGISTGTDYYFRDVK